jgi:acetyl-CoA synthetase
VGTNEKSCLTRCVHLLDHVNVSGHRFGTEELESALVSHQAVSEAAVVAVPNEITGEGIYAFVTTKNGIEATDHLKKELMNQLREKIGSIAKPDAIQWATSLPKTRSGKIMRRILHKIATGEHQLLGDVSTLAELNVIDELIKNRCEST